jgi:hypothetical protein
MFLTVFELMSIILNLPSGPVAIGVISVFAAVTATPFKSLSATVPL